MPRVPRFHVLRSAGARPPAGGRGPTRRRAGGWGRRVALALLLPLVAIASAQDDFAQMRDLLARGYYNSAAQLDGPALVRAHPDSADARYLYARALYLASNVGAARQQLDEALTLVEGPAPAEYNHLNGLLRAQEGDREGALRALENAFLRSGAYDYAMDWGRTAWRFGDYDAALEAYAAAAATPEGASEPWPWLDRGRILLLGGDPAAAVPELQAAIAAFEAGEAERTPAGPATPSPAYVEAFYRLGQAFEQLGDLARARANYESARSADPNYLPALRALDRVLRE